MRRGAPEPILASDQTGSTSSDGTSTSDDRQAGLIGLAGRILTSWANTCRVILLFAVVVGLLAWLLWWVPVDIEMGPVRISQH